MQVDAVIVGGGLAGLACGVALGDAGFRVAVVERGDVPGGRARSITDTRTGDVIDIGPHILLSEYRNTLHLMERLGTRDRITWETRKFITLVDGGRADEMRMWRLPPPLHFLPDLLRTPAVSFGDVISNRRVLWLAMTLRDADIADLDRMNARDLLERLGVSPRFMSWYWRTVAMTIMNVPLERCSAGSLLRFFHLMITHRGYRIGFPSDGLGRVSAEPAAEAIRERGGKVLLNTEAVGIHGEQHGVTGVRLGDGTFIAARACVACLPPQALHALLPSHWQSHYALFRNLRAFEPNPYVSSYLWFSRKLTQERFWARTWAPGNLNYDSYDLSNIRPTWSERPSLIANNIIYSDHAATMSDTNIIETTIRELEGFLPEIRSVGLVHARVNRIPMAIPAPVPGFERLRPQTRTPVRGLFVAGDWIGTGLPASMESAVCAGYRAAERAAEHLGRRIRVALPVREPEGIAGIVSRLANRNGTGSRRQRPR